ncbi:MULTISPECIES: HAMP domain-containing sensor histidine kinase [Bacillaceae]|uniref:histidine kinase n=1 Tax=Evansella alkalicola TaxID=745819 RepID=A0ABS6JSM5_9BACI|nr:MULTISPECIES: HAMP domain-containing sensor histidine kinase [Bacillaceae]MBU9720165.1 HAMP domain-containing histidine kinase [Bacillus alkalicola]
MKVKFTNSLQTMYIGLVICAMLVLPFSFVLASFFTYIPALTFNHDSITTYSASEIESMWHEKAQELSNSPTEVIINEISVIQGNYKDSSVYLVDGTGKTQFQQHSDESVHIPENWSPNEIITFMKNSYGGDPYTVVTLLEEYQGFMVFQIPRVLVEPPISQLDPSFEILYIAAVLLFLIIFVILSWLFFRRIWKRLRKLQDSMKMDHTEMPAPVTVGVKDEIGQLESSFNDMVQQLHISKERQQEEEQLRKELIANLSHDLRTPLSTIRAHNYTLSKETLTEEAKQSVQIIDKKIDYLNNLIENLLSYTLLSAGKYTFQPENIDVNRAIRASVAAWYPVFEQEQMEVEVKLTEEKIEWHVDPRWLERILDNLFQNVVRHAKSGCYIKIESCEQPISKIIISDKGPGMNQTSENTGVGVGLSIVELMAKEMNISWEVKSSEDGTEITLMKDISGVH